MKQQIFADPTYDVTFKMLFGVEENKNLTISFLNSLLGFVDDNEIEDLIIVNPDLGQDSFTSIKSSIDVRCKTKSGEDISIEIQRCYRDYFLARTQYYMSKIISGQLKAGDSTQYHTKMQDTYIVIIAKENVFAGQDRLKGDRDDLFEKTVVPMVKELNLMIPGNKMYWKFFELPKFRVFSEKKLINQNSPIKEQWLDFLTNCSGHDGDPENINRIIKQGYKIMKMANWTNEQVLAYDMSQYTEMCEKQSLEKKLADQLEKGIKLGKEEGVKLGKEEGVKLGKEEGVKLGKEEGVKLGKEEGVKLGKEEGIKQGEIKQIKNLLHLGVERSKILCLLEIVTKKEFDYICEHKNDDIIDIINFLDKKIP
jgi:predicted transposase/invertase (TIGR01784 family)